MNKLEIRLEWNGQYYARARGLDAESGANLRAQIDRFLAAYSGVLQDIVDPVDRCTTERSGSPETL